MAVAGTALEGKSSGYRHEAFLYSGSAEFLAGAASFIGHAVTAGDPILVVVSAEKIGLLRQELGAAADRVNFADMGEVGSNPGRIIALWREFVQDHPSAAQLWGIGEPVYPGRSDSELAECQLHEALLNVAFDAAVPFWLLCPYDLEALAGEVIDEAQRTHPYLLQGQERRACSSFQPLDLAAPFDRQRPSAPAGAAVVSFETGALSGLRAFVAEQAGQAGLDEVKTAGLVQAVNEVATNSVQHGGGRGELRAWQQDGAMVVEVSDQGQITAPLAGRLMPGPAGTQAGLWLANQLCDLVQLYSSASGTSVRLCQSR